MTPFTVGRKSEQDKLKSYLKSNKAEFIAVYGRRRVGKTHIIKHIIDQNGGLKFEVTGKQKGSLKDQLDLFTRAIEATFKAPFAIQAPHSWNEAFEMITRSLDQHNKNKTIILFFDELPWLATQKSGFIETLDHIWNTNWSYRKKLKLIVCGSAASWMLENLINAKGGLHNRITGQIPLRPFNIRETTQFLLHKHIKLTHLQILDLYMVMGGIPFYLDDIKKGSSAVNNINNMCFTADSLLYREFSRLYASLFSGSQAHIEIIESIEKNLYGIDQETLLAKLKYSHSGGTFTRRLEELEEAGFIISFIPYGNAKKGIYYRVIDEYTLFYLKWIKPARSHIKLITESTQYWQSKSQTPAWNNWAGYAFEAFCYKHIADITKALDIKVGYTIGTWRYQAKDSKDHGTQIDLLVDRDDGVINIIEIKYSKHPFRITKQYATILGNKIDIFREKTNCKKQIFLTIITVSGLLKNTYSDELVANQITLEDFF